jgi:hypothetical protein
MLARAAALGFALLTGAVALAQAPACFDAAQLQTASHKGSLIYVWSPRMVLSAQHASSAAGQAAQAGLQFIPVHDARVPGAEISAALSHLQASSEHAASAKALSSSQALCAPTLIAAEALRHFPTAFVAQGGRIHPHPIVGAMPEQAWAQSLRQRLSPAPDTCIAANHFAELPAALVGTQVDAYGKTQVALGSYERISPDGRFILRSFSGGRLGEVSLLELDAQGAPVTAYDTPLSNEAFPVQGTWRYLVDVNGAHYSLPSIVQTNSKTAAKPLFRGGMTGFYAAAAELPQTPNELERGQARIRSMSWPNATGDGDSQGEGALVARTLTVDTRQHAVMADSGNQHLCLDRVAQDGPLYALPMISVDGHEFAALPQTPVQGQQSMRIYSFGESGKGCTPRTVFSFASGKTIFGFPSADAQGHNQAADLAYEYKGQIWWFHRGAGMGAGERFNLAPVETDPHSQWIANAFPGITRDGRIIYAATRKTCSPDPRQPCTERVGYITADPYQSNAYRNHLLSNPRITGKTCITHGDVERERQAFARAHKLPPSK